MKKSIVAALLASAALFAGAQAPAYAPVQLDDLKVDLKQMVGKRVSTRALIQSMGEVQMLKSDPIDMTPIWAVTGDLPREDRKKLVSGCQMIECGGTFYGTVRNTPFGLGLHVERVEWR
jgi:hypothetical protein